MSDDLPEEHPVAPDTTDASNRKTDVLPEKPALPKRFYKAVEAPLRDGVHPLLLDGRPARTPARNPLAAPHPAIADVMVSEWQNQDDVIDPATMPMTRLLNANIDGVTLARDAVVDEIVRYAGSDLLCYRAGFPDRLVERQAALWDPVLAWARDELGARFVLSEGVMFVDQPLTSIEAVRAAVARQSSPHVIGGLHVLTSLAGSLLIALAVASGHMVVEEAWHAAHVDEDVQSEIWGIDEEAKTRRDARFAEFNAAATLVRALWEP
ncbi:ATP12 family chaperone protein [Pseudochelatococcus contaminans]|uniref:Chaperone required for assembly of F1-ATPase n=1 Tax=Pseudochelatococcus contaminans TaxID=1538103 RepID=A0A7W5Z4Z8_9HYPH|nr:ATP12 family protein [Pseudochelatococcus contaminans]MBB3809807.1 chaperone required for assembly of F1-ATPase [Pseudochelatococcus contaminans]